MQTGTNLIEPCGVWESLAGGAAPPQGARILVIDDEDSFRRTIATALRKRGFRPSEAPNGDAGVAQAVANPPDLIISDVCMANGDGYSVVQLLRANPVTALIPVILMTGSTQPGGMRQGMELGADDYLLKPFPLAQLWATVEARLKKLAAVQSAAERKVGDLRSHLCMLLPHELNTPLVGILGYGDILSSEPESLTPEELKDMGQDLLTSGRRLQRLVQNFLITAQLELLAPELRRSSYARELEAIEISGLIAHVASERAAAAFRSDDVQMRFSGTARVHISQDYLTKIAEELLDNAFKFSMVGTPVSVHVGSAVDGGAEVQITDRGCGIASNDITRIGSFERLNRHLQAPEGTGLGLSICRKLMDVHGGTFSIVSDPGTGTRVTLRFPPPAPAAD